MAVKDQGSAPRGSAFAGLNSALLTPQEVADLFRWSRDNVYVRAARGQLPGVVRIGHSLRFQSAAIRRLIEDGRVPTQPRLRRRVRRGSR